MRKIIFATGNEGKMVEIRSILSDVNAEILSMREAGVHMDIIEDGDTFEANALIKARAIAEVVKDAIILADDSGLEIDCLNKEPGIYSARYGGEDTSFPEKCEMLLNRMTEVEGTDRSGRFVCAIAAVFPDGSEKVCKATIEGLIGERMTGTNGFGYDPIVFLPEFGKSMAEITEAEKNEISHRGKALTEMKTFL